MGKTWGTVAELARALRSDPARLALCAGLAAGLVTSLAVNLPGHMSYDSVLQLWQGRTGVYNSWHPPVMAWLLGVGDRLVPGTALFVVFDSLLLYGSLAAFVFLRPHTSWWAAPVAVIWMASPQGLVYPGIVWKDVLFAASSLAGFAALAQVDARWARPRVRAAWLAGAILAWALAGLARQNGLFVPLCGAAGLALIAARATPTGRLRHAAAYGLGALAACGLIITASDAALATRSDGEPAALLQIRDLQMYDLIAAVKARPALRLDLIRQASPRLEQLIRTKGVAAYTPVRIDAIQEITDLQDAVSAAPDRLVSAQWRELVLRDPLLYLQVRWSSFGWVLLTPELDQCLPVFVGVDGPQPWLGKLGLKSMTRANDKRLEAWTVSLTDTPVMSHAAYALLALGVLARLLWRRRVGDLAVAAMIVAAFAFTASFFIVGLACDYRYLYDLDVVAMAAAFYLALGRGKPAAVARAEQAR